MFMFIDLFIIHCLFVCCMFIVEFEHCLDVIGSNHVTSNKVASFVIVYIVIGFDMAVQSLLTHNAA